MNPASFEKRGKMGEELLVAENPERLDQIYSIVEFHLNFATTPRVLLGHQMVTAGLGQEDQEFAIFVREGESDGVARAVRIVVG